MEIRVKNLNNTKFAAAVRGHEVICDQPPAMGGNDDGPTPPEFFLISLGTCAGYYASQYLNNHGISPENLEISVSAEKLTAPARLGNFHVDVHAPGLPAGQEAGLLRAVNACLIKNTLAQPHAIETTLHTAALVAA
jgi:putative redox protein